MKVSIITINYNDAAGLKKTLESVASQTSHNYEFIVIDGGSSDGSKEIIQSRADKISHWVSEPDNGIYNAMNKGVDAATGDYCIFMNSGDIFHSADVIAQFCDSNPAADIVCGNAVILEEPPRVKNAYTEITCDTLFSSAICHQAAFIKTDLMKKYGYDESLKIVADRKFFFTSLILDGCSYAPINLDIVDYDINGFSAQNRFFSEQEWSSVLSTLLPSRVLADYGQSKFGALYKQEPYEKLFLEIGRRRYKGLIYMIVVAFLRILSPIVESARFVKVFPRKIK